MLKNRTLTFTTAVWRYEGMGGWYFISLPGDDSDVIKDLYGRGRPGFGSIRVEVSVGSSLWKTSIFPDKKHGAYILPLKSEVRKKERIENNDSVKVRIKIL